MIKDTLTLTEVEDHAGENDEPKPDAEVRDEVDDGDDDVTDGGKDAEQDVAGGGEKKTQSCCLYPSCVCSEDVSASLLCLPRPPSRTSAGC